MQPHTQNFFQRLEITTGMHCSDLGCGGGDVTFELAFLVGKQGKVVGFELDETMIRLTQEDSQQLGLTNDELKDAQKSWIQRCNSIYGSSLS